MMTISQYFNKIEKNETIAERVDAIYEASIQSTIEDLEDILADLKAAKGIADVDDKRATLKDAKLDLGILSANIRDSLTEAASIEEGY